MKKTIFIILSSFFLFTFLVQAAGAELWLGEIKAKTVPSARSEDLIISFEMRMDGFEPSATIFLDVEGQFAPQGLSSGSTKRIKRVFPVEISPNTTGEIKNMMIFTLRGKARVDLSAKLIVKVAGSIVAESNKQEFAVWCSTW